MSEPSEWLYVLRPVRIEMLLAGPTHEEEATLERHFAYLKDLTDGGTVILAGRTLTTDADTFGIVVFRSESAETAREVMESDPAVTDGVMTARLYPYQIALLASAR